MTLSEAWNELGLDPGADAETVRRAYLRLIRTRKPESDPEGFQRARQAYEVARAGVGLEALARGSIKPSLTTTELPVDLSGAGVPNAGPSPGDAAVEGFVAAWNAVPPHASHEMRLEIAREAVAALPHEPRAHWLLVTTLSRFGNEPALADALRAGWRAGWLEFLETLLVRLPGRAMREEVDAAYASHRPSLVLAAAAASVTWQNTRSADVVIDLCRQAAVDTGTDGPPDLPLDRALDVVLALHVQGQAADAVRAHAAVRGWLHDTGLELAVANSELGGLWTLAEELASLPLDFPQPLRAAFANAARTADLSTAFYDAVSYIDRDRSTVRRWSKRLGQRPGAENVVGILREALAYQRQWKFSVGWARLGYLKLLIFPLFLTIIRHCVYEPNHSRPSTSIEAATASALPAQPYRPPGDDSVTLAEDAADRLCGPGAPRRGQLVCGTVEQVLLALRTRQCAEVDAGLHVLEQVLAAGRDGSGTGNGEAETKTRATDRTRELEARLLTRIELGRFRLCRSKERSTP